MAKKELTDIEKDVCAILSKYYPFNVDEIKQTYKKLESFDTLIISFELSSTLNISLYEAVRIVLSFVNDTKVLLKKRKKFKIF